MASSIVSQLDFGDRSRRHACAGHGRPAKRTSSAELVLPKLELGRGTLRPCCRLGCPGPFPGGTATACREVALQLAPTSRPPDHIPPAPSRHPCSRDWMAFQWKAWSARPDANGCCEIGAPSLTSTCAVLRNLRPGLTRLRPHRLPNPQSNPPRASGARARSKCRHCTWSVPLKQGRRGKIGYAWRQCDAAAVSHREGK